MDLPHELHRAIEELLDGEPLAELAQVAARQSSGYRAGAADGAQRVADRQGALAYVAWRLPATYGSLRAALGALAAARPGVSPESHLDLGAGPGTALWAVRDTWPGPRRTLLVESSPAVIEVGRTLAARLDSPAASDVAGAAASDTEWRRGSVASAALGDVRHELVTASYVLGELDADGRAACVERAWEATAGALVIVEPGTPAGFERIREARAQLIARAARVLAPCPHSETCPIEAPDWCHFSQRVARSRVHRIVKSGALGYEDEKFAYVAVARDGSPLAGGRAIRRPRRTKGRIELDLCTARGFERQLLRRRDGDAYRRAKKCRWGDVFETPAPAGDERAEPSPAI